MSYLNFILTVAVISCAGLWVASLMSGRKIWTLDRGFLGTLIIFYLLWWIGDFLAIKLGYYTYNPAFMLNVWWGGIPLEDHLAGVLVVVWIRGLFDLFERKT